MQRITRGRPLKMPSVREINLDQLHIKSGYVVPPTRTEKTGGEKIARRCSLLTGKEDKFSNKSAARKLLVIQTL